MIDFQLTRYTTLATDLSFFLYACVDMALVEHRWDDLVVEYHKALTDSLEKFGSSKDLITLEDLQGELKAHSVMGVGMSMEALIMGQLDDDDVSDLDAIKVSWDKKKTWSFDNLCFLGRRSRAAWDSVADSSFQRARKAAEDRDHDQNGGG